MFVSLREGSSVEFLSHISDTEWGTREAFSWGALYPVPLPLGSNDCFFLHDVLGMRWHLICKGHFVDSIRWLEAEFYDEDLMAQMLFKHLEKYH